MDPERRFLLGVLSLHTDEDAEGRERPFLVLETTEADTMHGALLEEFYTFVRHRVDGRLPLLLKPANHGQEHELIAISDVRVPRILGHELFGNRTRTPLNPGEAIGRLRYFRTSEEYAAAAAELGWSDIVAMPCLPDDVPRVAGFLNTAPITPLSHTNVLASGWGIPNAIVRDLDRARRGDGLDGAWIRYRVQDDEISLAPLADTSRPAGAGLAPAADPDGAAAAGGRTRAVPAPAAPRRPGPVRHQGGQPRASCTTSSTAAPPTSPPSTGSRGRPAPTCYGHLAARLGTPGRDAPVNSSRLAAAFAAGTVAAPDGIALPFALQHRFLKSSPGHPTGHRQAEDGARTRRRRRGRPALPAPAAAHPQHPDARRR